MKPLKVYIPIPRAPGYNASFYYRLDCPFITMEEAGLPVETIVDHSDPEIPMMNRVYAFYHSDIAMFYQPTGASILEEIRRLQSFGMAHIDGQWTAPPSIVVNTDDNLFMVHPKNPAFRDLGIRMPDGRLLAPAGEVGEMTESGRRKVIWRGRENVRGNPPAGTVLPDGSVVMDVRANQNKLSIYRDILTEADSVVCSTPTVEEYVRQEANPRRTFVSPNMVRFDHYEQVDLAPHPDEIRILWQGSTTHYEDFIDLTDVLPTILKQYPQVKFIFWGAKIPWIMENIPTDRYTFIPWCPYQEYKLRLVMMGHDIAIAPLRPHRFNVCRSAIKYYESTVMRQPAAFLGQNTGPYAAEVIDGQTGMLWNTPYEFGDKLRTLIENEKLRREIASNGKQWVRENRDAMKLVKPLYEHLRELREDKARGYDIPEMKWDAGMEDLKRDLEKHLGPEEDSDAECPPSTVPV